MKRLIPLLLLNVSCAVMSKEECAIADWSELGRRDGGHGNVEYYFEERAKACEENGFKADRENYLKGRKDGLLTYCTYDNGVRQGTRGYRYGDVCPAELESEFLKGYELGKTKREVEEVKESLQIQERKIRLLQMQNGTKHAKECRFDSDCEIRDSCHFSKCSDSGMSCHFSSDCSIRGDCQNGSCRYRR